MTCETMSGYFAVAPFDDTSIALLGIVEQSGARAVVHFLHKRLFQFLRLLPGLAL